MWLVFRNLRENCCIFLRLVAARPSLLERLPKIATKIEHHRVQLSCTGESIPPPIVTWFKNGESISSSKHIVIRTSGTFERVSTLTIEKVKYEDRGEFTCSFTNYRGNVNSTGRLIVYGKFDWPQLVSLG